MQRVTFPLLSRFQGDRKQFASSLERSVRISGLGTLFFVGVIFGFGAPLVSIIYTDKWLPAMPLLYIYAGVLALGFLAPLVSSAIDAMGRPDIVLKLSAGWTILAWLGVLYATPRWGMVGFAAGFSVHVVAGNLAVLWVLKLLVPEASVLSRLWAPVAGATIIALLGHHFMAPHITNLGGVILAILASLVVYMGTVLALDRAMLRALVSVIRSREP